MNVILPDHPALASLSPEQLRIELACTMFATGRASSLAAAEIAGLGYADFLDELRERRIPLYTTAMLREDIENLNRVFPDHPLPLPRF